MTFSHCLATPLPSLRNIFRVNCLLSFFFITAEYPNRRNPVTVFPVVHRQNNQRKIEWFMCTIKSKPPSWRGCANETLVRNAETQLDKKISWRTRKPFKNRNNSIASILVKLKLSSQGIEEHISIEIQSSIRITRIILGQKLNNIVLHLFNEVAQNIRSFYWKGFFSKEKRSKWFK